MVFYLFEKKYYLKRKIKVCVLRFFFILRSVCEIPRYIKSVLYRVTSSSTRSSSRLDTLSCIHYIHAFKIVLGSNFAWVAPNGVTLKWLYFLSCFIPMLSETCPFRKRIPSVGGSSSALRCQLNNINQGMCETSTKHSIWCDFLRISCILR